MKKWFILLAFILAMVFLVSCQSGDGDAYPAPGEARPVPTVNRQYPYPEIVVATEPPSLIGQGGAAYPDISGNSTVEWYQAETMILNGELAKIVFLPENRLEMSLKDGRVMFTRPPNEEILQATIDACGELCNELVIEE